MCEERENVTRAEFESPGFEEKKKKKEAEGFELEPMHGSIGVSPSDREAQDPSCIEYVAVFVKKKVPKNTK